ncbi:MAG: hypothetical protein IPK60_20270 [Sandaracinaceae bacterium]|nr:hypothetical protein [Sandaracinaceae bacterium]
MKKLNRFTSFGLVLALSLAGCGGPSQFALVGSGGAAGADGNVQVEEVDGGNHLLTIHVEHLPPPERLAEGLTTYAVWLVANGQAAVKAGHLDFDSESRMGNLVATTPLSDFELKITAESDANASTPGNTVVLTRQITAQ